MCIDVIGAVHPLKTELDEEMFQHIIYALNSILLTLRDGGGFNKETIIKSGKTLLRLSALVRAYVHKKSKENIPAEEFAKRMLSVISGLHDDFIGVPHPF